MLPSLCCLSDIASGLPLHLSLVLFLLGTLMFVFVSAADLMYRKITCNQTAVWFMFVGFCFPLIGFAYQMFGRMSAAVLVLHLGSCLSLCVYSLSDSRTRLDDASIEAKGETLGLFQRRVGNRCQKMQRGCMCFGFGVLLPFVFGWFL